MKCIYYRFMMRWIKDNNLYPYLKFNGYCMRYLQRYSKGYSFGFITALEIFSTYSYPMSCNFKRMFVDDFLKKINETSQYYYQQDISDKETLLSCISHHNIEEFVKNMRVFLNHSKGKKIKQRQFIAYCNKL